MPNPLFDIKGLRQELEIDSQILVPNRRLARHINSAWGHHCYQQGLRAWRQPWVQTQDAWLLECWHLLQDRGYQDCFSHSIINPHAERLIWEQVIDNDADKPAGIDGSAFARMAQAALQNLQRWQVPFAEVAQSGHEASQHLLRWHREFANVLADRHLLTPAQAQTFVAQAFEQSFLAKQARIVLLGFNTEPAPLYRRIIDAAFFESIYWHEAEKPVAKQICVAANDTDEISRAAQWAKQTIDSQPDQRVGLVFTNLASQRHCIDRIFREVFTPEYGLPDAPHAVPPYNISAGLPLSDSPLVASALDLLKLQRSPQPLAFYCNLLNNPFWGDSANEQIVRAQCQLLLRKGYKLQPASADLRYCIKRAEDASLATNGNMDGDTSGINSADNSGTSLSQCLQQFEDRCRQQAIKSNQHKHSSEQNGGEKLSSRNSFAFWTLEFSARLKILGWPGTRALDSIEYQQQQLWLDVLEEFTRLDNSIDPVDAATALTQLIRVCRGRIFQAEGGDSPVQVLGLLEATGLHFDHLWVAEMHDGQWPQSPDYNPLLPVSLQRLHQMPRSSAEEELKIARQMLVDFENHCQHIVFSFGLRDGDSERQISRLLDSDLPHLQQTPGPFVHPLIARMDKPELQKIAIDQAPPLVPEDKPVRGGSAILRDQAGCPFNAFVIWRLGAEALPEPAFGFTNMERGVVVHYALELFWATCKDSSTLKAMDLTARDTLLEQSIATALTQAKTDRPDLFGPRFSAIENDRLFSLLSAWLDIEQERSAFSVAAREEKINLQLSQLNLSLRIDRIDQLEDGSIMLIDYKTGGASIKGFADERPEEPQLLLYALATDQPLAALCFGQISATKGITLKGVTNRPDLLPSLSDLETAGLADTWAETLDLWQERLSGLAAEFCAGDAEVVFYSNAAANYQNYLLPLNRWFEINTDRESTTDEHQQ
ncbi:MAG: hypothetical protein DRR06_06980 [Gammaproteobacteria bacterium]|nr:MAG: hypothetical protein DRR06_06980 [Gammaproteobacteria bacterium]